jgi:uncharacterized protein YnzC (UPF0291/DUF896 family)
MSATMTKVQLIERISQLNRSAGTEFLAEFEEAELQQYLNNLEMVWNDFQEQFYQTSEITETEYEFEPSLMAG